MMKSIRIGLFLAIVAALMLFGVSAIAETSGTCGDNLTWTLDDEGTLTISGAGMMWNFSSTYVDGLYVTTAPWGNNVKTVVIKSGVTSIGQEAFYGCSSLTSVTIPDSVTSIDEFASSGCSSLTDFNVESGNTVYSSQNGVLYSKDGKTIIRCPGGRKGSFIIPSSVTGMGYAVFADCGGLTSVTIPDSVNYIGDFVFSGCRAIKYANLDTDGAKALSKAGYSFRVPDTKYDLKYLSQDFTIIGLEIINIDKDAMVITIPEGVTSIGSHAFSGCSSLTSVTIPEGVTSIGSEAFSGCSGLTSVTIPEGVTSIGNNAFRGCSSLTSVTIPEGVTSIGDWAFYDCRRLTSVTIPEGVTSIGNGVFWHCSSLRSVTIPDSVTSIGEWSFSDCSSLTSVTIPGSVTSIGYEAFDCCGRLSKVAFLGGENDPLSIGSYAFDHSGVSRTYYCYMFSPADDWCAQQGITPIYLDDIDIDTIRIVSLPNDFRMARGDCRTISAYVFPDMGDAVTWQSSAPSVVSVNEGVITAHSLGSAAITATVGSVSDSVSVEVYVPATGFELSSNELWVAAKDSVQLSVTDIEPTGAEAEFTWSSSDTALATVNATGLVTTIKPGDVTITATTETGVSRSCLLHLCYPVTGIAFDPAEVSVMQGGRVALTANVTTRTQSLVNKLVTFESSDTSVATVDADGVVTGCGLGTAMITATAFSGVSASCTVTVREAYTLTLPVDLTAIQDEAFMNDTSLEAVIVPEGCQSIGARAFAGCANLQYIRIPAGTSVAADAFEGCDGVTIDRAE